MKNGNKIASKQRFCDIFRSKDVHEERQAKNMPKKRRTGRGKQKIRKNGSIFAAGTLLADRRLGDPSR
ncbi:MAG: hypothetical protein PUB84_01485 [Bacteroidales bacterium]|nr:hypothetical protein [Bacteroidales bacterium]